MGPKTLKKNTDEVILGSPFPLRQTLPFWTRRLLPRAFEALSSAPAPVLQRPAVQARSFCRSRSRRQGQLRRRTSLRPSAASRLVSSLVSLTSLSQVSASAAEVPRTGRDLALPHPPPRPRTLSVSWFPSKRRPGLRTAPAPQPGPESLRQKKGERGSACGERLQGGACTGHLFLILVLAVCHKSMSTHCPLSPPDFRHPTMPDPSELDEEAFARRFCSQHVQRVTVSSYGDPAFCRLELSLRSRKPGGRMP